MDLDEFDPSNDEKDNELLSSPASDAGSMAALMIGLECRTVDTQQPWYTNDIYVYIILCMHDLTYII